MGRDSSLKGITPRNGHIRIIIHHKKTRQKPFHKTLKIKPTKANLKYAQRQREAWLHQLELGQIPPELSDNDKDALLIPNLLREWFDTKSNKLKSSTFHNYRKAVAILTIEFDGEDARDLSLGRVRDFCDGQTSTAKTINNLISPLRQSLQKAVEDEKLERNVMQDWSYKKPRFKTDDDVDPFTTKEQQAILDALTGQNKNLVQLAFWTGMRPSEFIALTWSDVDFDNQTISVSKVRTTGSTKVEAPKTAAGLRTIKLLKPAQQALEAQKEFTYDTGKEIFLNPNNNKPWSGDQQLRRRLWIPCIEKSGVRYRYPYQTRHTYASMMLSAGEHPMWVAKMMGHSDWTMIAKIYGKWMPEAMPDAGDKAVSIFGSFSDRF